MKQQPASMQARLIVSLGLAMLVLFVALGFFLDRLLEHEMSQLFDRALFEKARTFSTLVEWEDGWVEVNYDEKSMQEFKAGPQAQYFMVLDGATRLGQSASYPSAPDTEAVESILETGFRDLLLPDGRKGRAIVFTFKPVLESDPAELEEPAELELYIGKAEGLHYLGLPRQLTLEISRERGSLDAQLSNTRRVFSLGLGGLWLMVLTIVWRMVRFNLKPLAHFAREVQTIDSAALDQRIRIPQDRDTELLPIAEQINHLLERIEEAFLREKHFSAHVAHELRTPVAELRSLTAVSHRFVGDSSKLEPLLNDLDSLGIQMQEMIVSLLALARSENGDSNLKPVRIALSPWLAELVKSLELTCQGDFRLSGPADMCVLTDPAALRIILRNLLCNAIQHSTGDGPVHINWKSEAGRWSIDLRNQAAELQPEQLDQITQRFWKGDQSRSEDGHLGLGLSICRALAARLGISLEFRLEAASCFVAEISGE